LTVRDSVSFSRHASSNSTCSGEGTRPGFEAANAASAASLASFRILITTLTSTPHFRAHPTAKADPW
jgi:hypothetical protein